MSVTTNVSPPRIAPGQRNPAPAPSPPAAAPWKLVWSQAAAMRAVRATVVVTGLFALTDLVIGNLQMALFAAFGSFATLVLSSFAGNRREKLLAHAALAVTGSVLLTIGTAVNSSTALAAIVTLPVTFCVFFAGVMGPNAASGSIGALLPFVLPAASPGTISMVPDRLAGWWLASIVGTAAVLAFSPPADELASALKGTAEATGLDACLEAKSELLARFTATPYRPTGLASPDQALANSVELLEWCTALVADTVRERDDLRDAAEDERRLLQSTVEVLREVGRLFAGATERPDLQRLENARTQSLAQLGRVRPQQDGFHDAAQVSFHAHAIAVAVLALGAAALIACRLGDRRELERERGRWYASTATAARQRASAAATVAARHASVRSVWFVNSARAAVALSLAVTVADLSSVQHGFWVVLGTLSVLRTNAAATGATALRALLGTALGFAIGGALLLVIGTASAELWVALPVAVFVAAYTPGTAPFALGQAAFTVTIAVLFNLLVPVGWKVGVVRIEDVAIGCAVSVVVGSLFWPRGVSSVVGDDLADAFRAGAGYLLAAVQWAGGARTSTPNGMAAVATASRLEEALRGFLAEQGSKRIPKGDLWHLVGGSLRLRLTAHAVAQLPRDATGSPAAGGALENRAQTLAAWYGRLADLVDKPHGKGIATLGPPLFDPTDKVDASTSSHYGVWLCEHLDHLAEHTCELVGPARTVAEVRRRPWWR